MAIASIQISNFDVKNVESMLGMFHRCNSLTSLNVPNFETQNLEGASYFLSYCEQMKYLDFSKFNSLNLKNYENIFENISEEGTIKYDENIFNISDELPDSWVKDIIDN